MARPAADKSTRWKKPNWFGGNKLGGIKLPEDYVGRWCDASDEAKIERRLDEGWVFVNKTTCPGAAHDIKDPDVDVKDGSGSASDGALKRRGMIAMMLPLELAEDRRQAVVDETAKQTKAKVQMSDAKQKLGRHGEKIKPTLVIN